MSLNLVATMQPREERPLVQTLCKVTLHGALGERFGKTRLMAVSTPAEAVRALVLQNRGFREAIRMGTWRVVKGPLRKGRDLSIEELGINLGAEMHIIPVPEGRGKGKGGGAAKTIIGVALIAVAIVAQQYWVAGAAAGSFAATAGPTIVGMTLGLGVSMTMSGISQMLAPTPKSKDEQKYSGSYLFNGATNTSDQGAAIPLTFGESIVGSVLISTGLDIEDISDGETLRSQEKLRTLHLISEGPCYGCSTGPSADGKSIFLNGTPLTAEDGSSNFPGVSVEYRGGWAHGSGLQNPILGFPTAEAVVGVGSMLTKNNPIIKNFDTTNADRIKIAVEVPALYKMNNKDNSMEPLRVAVKMSYKRAGTSTWTEWVTEEIGGKIVSPYRRMKTFTVPSDGSGKITSLDVKLERTTDNFDGSTTMTGYTSWAYVVLVTDRKLTYPHCSILGLTFDAKEFGGQIPTITFRWKGMFCQVPKNYNAATRTYATVGPGTDAGYWDGTFPGEDEMNLWQVTSNPAWILWNLLTNPRWGCGNDISPGMVDKWALYEIAKYCDESIDNGIGGTEPRYTWNGAISSRDEAYRVIQAVAQAFRGMTYWGAGVVVPVADRPHTTIAQLVTRSNVIGRMRYEGVSQRVRHSVAHVRWRDTERRGQLQVEAWDDRELIEEVGLRTADYDAVGCTSRGLARRTAKWVIYSEKYETKTLTYRAGYDQADVAPGEVILVLDSYLRNINAGGRLRDAPTGSAAGSLIHLDRPIEVPDSDTFRIRLALADGRMSEPCLIVHPQTGTSTNVDPTETVKIKTGNTLQVADLVTGDISTVASDNLSEPGAVWIIEVPNKMPLHYRVMSVEQENDGILTITALRHNPSKYGYIEAGLALTDEDYNVYAPKKIEALPAPGTPVIREWRSGMGDGFAVNASVSWAATEYLPSGGDPELTVVVTGAFSGTGGQIELTTATDHPFVTGSIVSAYGFVGVPTANGTWQIEDIGDRRIRLVGSTFSGSYITGGVVSSRQRFAHPDIDRYRVELVRQDDQSIAYIGHTNGSTTYDFRGVSPGTYKARVRAQAYDKRWSPWATGPTTNIDGYPDALAAPTDLTAVPGATSIMVRWNNPTNKSFFRGVQVLVAPSNDINQAGQVVETTSGGWLDAALPPSTARYYWVRTVDIFGRTSATTGPIATSTLASASGTDVSATFLASHPEIGIYATLVDVMYLIENYNHGKVFYTTTDGKYWRCVLTFGEYSSSYDFVEIAPELISA